MNQTVSRLIVVGIVGLGSLFCIEGGPTAESAAEAGMISGTGSLSGKVQAPKPFKAARVYAKNVDKNMLFMVYTSAGRFRAVNLLPEWPGSYSTLGIFYYQTGEIAKARELLARFKGSNAGGLDVNRIEQALAQAPEQPSTLNEPMPENARVQFLQMALSVADRTL